MTHENSLPSLCTSLEQGECTNDAHDHYVPEEAQADQAHTYKGYMLCNDCQQNCHWDEGFGDYVHDDPKAKSCFLAWTISDLDVEIT